MRNKRITELNLELDEKYRTSNIELVSVTARRKSEFKSSLLFALYQFLPKGSYFNSVIVHLSAAFQHAHKRRIRLRKTGQLKTPHLFFLT